MTQCEGAYFNEWLIIDWLTKTVKKEPLLQRYGSCSRHIATGDSIWVIEIGH